MAKEKPLTVMREEFVDNLINLINSSGLPFFIVLDVMKSAQTEVQEAAKKQYEEDLKKYSESSEDEKEEVIIDA